MNAVIVGRVRIRSAWEAGLLSLCVALLALPAAGVALADDDIPQPLPVGTTVDLSVASVGAAIRDVAVADQTYVVVEDQGLWVLQGDGKTIEKASAPAESMAAVATDGAQYYIATEHGLFAGHAGEWHLLLSAIISALCIQPDPPLYIAGGHHGLFRSEDGEHWTAVDLPDVLIPGCAIAGTTAYAATSGGVYRSIDSGQSWAEAHQGITTRYVAAVAVAVTSIYAVTGGAGLYASNDRAGTWMRVEGPPPALEDVKVSGGVISVWGDGILRQSSDGGATWTSTEVAGADNLNAVQFLADVAAHQ